jgi:hypothetical protein
MSGLINVQPAQFPKGEVADVQNYVVEAATVFLRGDPADIDGSGELVVTTSPVAAGELVGFTLEPTTAAGTSSNPSGLLGVAKAKNSQIFAGQITSAAGVAALTNLSGVVIGQAVGCVKSTLAGSYLNEWLFLVGGTGFTVTKIDDNLNLVWCQAILATLNPLA